MRAQAPEPLEATRWLESFAQALRQNTPRAAAELFAPECYWRDLVAFAWDIRTHEGRDTIRRMLEARLAQTKPRNWHLANHPTSSADEAWFTFETAAGRGVGHLRLREGRAWTLLTALRELHDHPEKPGKREPDLGITRQPQVVIVGGGQGGIALGARLKCLGVPAVILEKNARAGDSWRKRYASLVLHDPVWYDHMPYKPFPPGWPVFTPKDMLGDWLEAYVDEEQLDYWGGSPCLSASRDEERGVWNVQTLRNGQPLTLHPKHLVLATGMSGFPSIPTIPGAGDFRGTIVHSSAFEDGTRWAGITPSTWRCN